MDHTRMPGPVIEALADQWWLLAVAAAIALARMPLIKGWLGELLVRIIARLRLKPDVYRAFHDVTLATPDGTTQIDHVFVSPYGVFVVETKNMKGWIFGGERQHTWTQKIYRHNRTFQNPLRQNYKHTEALRTLLDLRTDVVHSIVVFAGDSRFKTRMPANVVHGGGYVRYIRRFRERVFSDSEVEAICSRLAEGRLAPTRETQRAHVGNVSNREQAGHAPACPRCGAGMTLRTIRKGKRTGHRFWGCSRFPRCRGATWCESADEPIRRSD